MIAAVTDSGTPLYRPSTAAAARSDPVRLETVTSSFFFGSAMVAIVAVIRCPSRQAEPGVSGQPPPTVLSRALRYPECSVFGLVGVVVVACCSG
jgi:hypothetical protein